MLSVWLGTSTRAKVYFSPKLVYLRVAAIGAQDLVPHDASRPMNASVKLQLAGQVRRTRPGGPPGTHNPMCIGGVRRSFASAACGGASGIPAAGRQGFRRREANAGRVRLRRQRAVAPADGRERRRRAVLAMRCGS